MTEFPALVRWQNRIDQYREQQARQGPPMWEKKGEWYDRWVEGNDYHQHVLPYLIHDFTEGDKVLEIGPGTGAFTMALAEAGADILCFEPSRKMRECLEAKLDQRKLSNVEILPEKVEDSLDIIQQRAPFQHTLASFSIYNVREIDRVMETLMDCSKRIYILMGTGVRSPWYQALVQQLDAQQIISAPQLDLFYPFLLEKGIFAEVRILWSSQNYIYDDEGSMLDCWQKKLALPVSRREELAAALRNLAVQRNGQLGIFSSRPMALVMIEGQKQIQEQDIDISNLKIHPSVIKE